MNGVSPASCQAQSEGAAVWGSFHGIRSDRLRVWRSSLIRSCYGSSRFADVHEEVFADRFYPVEAGFPRDLPEFFFGGGERDPRGPREGGPGIGEEVPVFWISMRWVGIGRHL